MTPTTTTTITTTNTIITKNEILFWKVIRDKVLFNTIFNILQTSEIGYTQEKEYYIGNRIQWKYICSMEWMIINNQYSLLKDKLKNKQYVLIDFFGLETFFRLCKDIETIKLLVENKRDDIQIQSIIELSIKQGNLIACNTLIDLNCPISKSTFISLVSSSNQLSEIGTLESFKKLIERSTDAQIQNYHCYYPLVEILILSGSNSELIDYIISNNKLYSIGTTIPISIENYLNLSPLVAMKIYKLSLVEKSNIESKYYLIKRIVKSEPLEMSNDQYMFLIESMYLVCMGRSEIPIDIQERITKIKSLDNDINRKYHFEMILIEQLQDQSTFSEYIYKFLYKTNNLTSIVNWSSMYYYSFKSLCMDALCLLMSNFQGQSITNYHDQISSIKDCKLEICELNLINSEPDRVIAYLQLYYSQDIIKYDNKLEVEFIKQVFLNCSIQTLDIIFKTNNQYFKIFNNLYLGQEYTIPFSKYSWFIKRYCQFVSNPDLSFFNCNIEFSNGIQDKKDFIDILSVYQTQRLNLPFNSTESLGSIETCEYYKFKIHWNPIADIYKFVFNHSLESINLDELSLLQSSIDNFNQFEIDFIKFKKDTITVLSLFKYINDNPLHFQSSGHLFKLFEIYINNFGNQSIIDVINVMDLNKFQVSTIQLLFNQILKMDYEIVQLIFSRYTITTDHGHLVFNEILSNQSIESNTLFYTPCLNIKTPCKIEYLKLSNLLKLVIDKLSNVNINGGGGDGVGNGGINKILNYLYNNLLTCNGITFDYLVNNVFKFYKIDIHQPIIDIFQIFNYIKIKSIKQYKYLIKNKQLIQFISNNGNGIGLGYETWLNFTFYEIVKLDFKQWFFKIQSQLYDESNIQSINCWGGIQQQQQNNYNNNPIQLIYNIKYLLSVGEIEIILNNKSKFNQISNYLSIDLSNSSNGLSNNKNSIKCMNSKVSKINKKLTIGTSIQQIIELNETIFIHFDGKDLFKWALQFERTDLVKWLMNINSSWIQKFSHHMMFGNHLEISEFIFTNYPNEFTIDQLSLNEILHFGYQNMFNLIISSLSNISPTIQKLKDQLIEKDQIIKSLLLKLNLKRKYNGDDDNDNGDDKEIIVKNNNNKKFK